MPPDEPDARNRQEGLRFEHSELQEPLCTVENAATSVLGRRLALDDRGRTAVKCRNALAPDK